MDRRLRSLPVVHTGQPAPFAVTGPAFATATAGWLAAAVILALNADALAQGAISSAGPVLAAHLIGLVLFPFAVAGAAWQLLPVMLRNDPPTARARPLALGLLASGAPLAAAVALDLRLLANACAALLGVGLLLVLGEVAALVSRAPREQTLVVSRPAVVLAGLHAALAFAAGVYIVADRGAEPLGLPYERFVLVHLSIAVVGWLTILIAAVGRTLVPMLGLAPASRRRRVPAAEAALAAGLWTYVGGLGADADPAVAGGIALMLVGAAPVGLTFGRAAGSGRIGVREGPVAHAVVGLFFAFQAAGLGIAAALGAGDRRQLAIAAVVLVGVGWAVGVVVGHLGKLASLSGWGSWPPGPRPRQEALYPRRLWQAEVALFAVGVELLALGVLLALPALASAGGAALAAAALAGCAGVAETVRRVLVGRGLV